MAQSGVQLEQKAFSCSICLDLLKDPVLIPCGHSYCMSCIETHWDKEDEKRVYSCPQCGKSFSPRPVLEKNDMLKALVEEVEKTGLEAAPADPCQTGPEDVACDVCAGMKRKACESCKQRQVSDCGEVTPLHCESTALKKQKLEENVCPQHHEVMKMFCRAEQRPFCHLCPWDEHIDHDTAPSAAERTERQQWLNQSQGKIRQGIRDREKDVKLLQQELDAINGSADEAVEHSQKMFAELVCLMERRFSDLKQQIRSRQEAEVSRLKKPQEKLKQEIADLKRKEAELQKLSKTEDDNQFLQDYPPLSSLRVSTYSSIIWIRPVSFFKDVKAAVTKVRNKLSEILSDKWANVLQPASVMFLQLQPAPPPKPQKPAPPPKPQQPLRLPKPQQKHQQVLILLPVKPQQPLLLPKSQPLLTKKTEPEQPLLTPKPDPEPEQLLSTPKTEPEQPPLSKLNPNPQPEHLTQPKTEPEQPLLTPKPEPELLLAKLEPEQPPQSNPNPNPQPKTEPEPGPELSS